MMDKGSENFVSAFVFGYFCLRENKMLFLQYGNDEDEEIFLRLALCSLLVVQAVAQSSFRVTGKVIDRTSRQPVVGAFVSPASIDTVRAVTDTAGVFVLPHVPPGIFHSG